MNVSQLRNLSLGYLILPNLIFSAWWFKFPVALLTIIGFLYLFKLNVDVKANIDKRLGRRDIVGIGLLALVLVAFSGIGGLSFQVFDYWSHNSKYNTLFSHSWPVVFRETGQYACHYFGFFLVPALISKLLGSISDSALYLWASFGLFLGLCWVYIISNKSIPAFCLLFCLGGAGHLVKVVLIRLAGLSFFVPPFFIEVWPFLYQIQWAPNQMIPTLLCAGIVFSDYCYLQKPEKSTLAIISLFIWAVFPGMVFTAVISVMILLKYWKTPKYLLQSSFLKLILISALVFIPIFVYLLSARGAVIGGFIWTFDPLNEIGFHYFFGVLTEIAIFLAVIYILNLHKSEYATIIYSLFFLLVIVSMFRMGKWNDWFLRGNTVIVTLLCLFVMQRFAIWIKENPFWYRRKTSYILFMLIVSGIIVPASLLIRALKKNQLTSYFSKDTDKFHPYRYGDYENFYEMGKVIYSKQEAEQWAASKGSFYEHYLARASKN